MNGTTNTTAFAGFAPGEHRQLLADVNRWRRTNGWNWGDTRGLVNGRLTCEATIAVDWAPADDKPQGFSIARRDPASRRWSSPDFYPAASVRQAVDLLAVLGVLPVQFSSQYKAGWHDGFFHTVEDETAAEIKASWSTLHPDATEATAPANAAENLAALFHATYERLAPQFGYRTRTDSARPWAEVPEQNRLLMVATCAEVLAALTAAAAEAVDLLGQGVVPTASREHADDCPAVSR